ncbi:HprK-related kinase A [Aquincola sp. S2]|uniref:HprK-related kinase A n=1 Tax=Pseudaquabacterium terrae TaxID=2732868 RepID=A0ABX2ED65_9BURK|nr:HprK-related kinase A [Aquabacterium terrae]
MTLGALGPDECRARLARGLTLDVGPFRYRVQTGLPSVAENLATLYGDFPIGDDAGLRDFHVRVDPVTGVRRYWRAQVNFWFDGWTPFRPLQADHAFAMLEWGMNWCVAAHAHHYLLLHAAVLERNGRCVILPGDPGAGKSTLTAALMLSGWRLLSDELTVIDRDDGSLLPLARPVSLKNQSIDVIRAFDERAVFGTLAADTHKGSVCHLRPTPLSVARAGERGQAAHIVFPRWRAGAPTRLLPRPKADAFMHVATHAFNYSLLGRLGFEMTAALIDRCDCWDFGYSQLPEALRRFEELVA